MGKLHELLAVETGVKNRYVKVLDEAKSVFVNKHSLFQEYVRTLKLEEEDEFSVEDRSAMSTTVSHKLNWIAKFISEYIDISLQKELSNCEARGALVLPDEEPIYLPATFLLGLEAKLARLRSVIEKCPTLPPGARWVKDPLHRYKNVYCTKFAEETNKTKKVIKPFVLYEATKEHPAQVEKLTEDIVVGRFKKTSWTGALPSAQKAEILSRLDKLIEEAKKARQRANTIDAKKETIGELLMEYILGEEVIECGLGEDVEEDKD